MPCEKMRIHSNGNVSIGTLHVQSQNKAGLFKRSDIFGSQK